MSTHIDRPLDLRAAALAIVIAAIWGGNLVALKLGFASIPPLWSAFWRMAIALPFLYVWTRMERDDLRLTRDDVVPLSALALLFFGQIGLLNLGTDWTSPAYAVILLNANPVFASVLAHYFLPDDRLSWLRVLGLAIAVTGVSFVFLGRPSEALAPRPYLGNATILLSSVLVASRMIYTKRIVIKQSVTRTIFWQVTLSLPLFLAAAAAVEPLTTAPLTPIVVGALLYQGVLVAGIVFILWIRLLRTHSAGLMSMFIFPMPIFGVIFSGLVFAEQIPAELVFGLAAVASGILIATWAQRRDARRRRDASGQKLPGPVRRAA